MPCSIDTEEVDVDAVLIGNATTNKIAPSAGYKDKKPRIGTPDDNGSSNETLNLEQLLRALLKLSEGKQGQHETCEAGKFLHPPEPSVSHNNSFVIEFSR
jgi:hypothetical protein